MLLAGKEHQVSGTRWTCAASLGSQRLSVSAERGQQDGIARSPSAWDTGDGGTGLWRALS